MGLEGGDLEDGGWGGGSEMEMEVGGGWGGLEGWGVEVGLAREEKGGGTGTAR